MSADTSLDVERRIFLLSSLEKVEGRIFVVYFIYSPLEGYILRLKELRGGEEAFILRLNEE